MIKLSWSQPLDCGCVKRVVLWDGTDSTRQQQSAESRCHPYLGRVNIAVLLFTDTSFSHCLSWPVECIWMGTDWVYSQRFEACDNSAFPSNLSSLYGTPLYPVFPGAYWLSCGADLPNKVPLVHLLSCVSSSLHRSSCADKDDFLLACILP